MKIAKMVVLSFLFLHLVGLVHAQVPQAEREALIAFYESTKGDGWTNKSGWKTGGSYSAAGTECGWFGVDCNVDDRVYKLQMGDNNLDGPIPADIEDLPYLRYLFLQENNLTGNIPPELGTLPELRTIQFMVNQLSGNIPSELGALTQLTYLDLADNNLEGSIPSSLGNLTELTHLYLGGNGLTGTIPSGLGNLAKLEWLGLGSNKLSGQIPSSLGNLAELVYLSLDWNQLSGKIPPELGKLAKLETLSLDNNQLEGSLPPALGDLESLKILYLNDNNLWGCIPSALGDCGSLEKINIASNHFSGEVPEEIVNLTALLDGQSDFQYNHLETSNTDVKNFLDQKQDGGNWESYQTFDTTPIAHVEPGEDCGGYTPCYASIEDAMGSMATPGVILVGEGEYPENVTIGSGFSLEMTWDSLFSCSPPQDPVAITGPPPPQ